MLASKVVLLVRDAKTSKILRSPPKEQLWLHREKAGFGRALENEWIVRWEVGEKFFEKVPSDMRGAESNRDWHFGFNDYYDTLLKAHRFASMQDQYRPAEPILKTTTHDPGTMRTRDLKPGEDAMSIWEEVQKGRNRMLNTNGERLEEQIAPDLDQKYFYGEADALEDEGLVPEEFSTEPSNALYSGTVNALENFGNEGPNRERFIKDLDTDEELPSDESDEDEEEWEDESGDEEWEDETGDEEEYEHITESRNPLAMLKDGKMEDLLSLVFSEEQRKDMALLDTWKPPGDFRADVKADFNTFFDREKSRPFKAGWHAADLAPGGPGRWQEAQTIVK
ncbi:MAG: hypothetical protein Q9226_004532 [Calogaya cf. arnoldii]